MDTDLYNWIMGCLHCKEVSIEELEIILKDDNECYKLWEDFILYLDADSLNYFVRKEVQCVLNFHKQKMKEKLIKECFV